MTNYTAPTEEIKFILNDVLGIDELFGQEKFKDLSADLTSAVIDEAGKFANEKLSPINRSGDINGCSKVHDDIVETPAGFKGAYAEFIQNGWNSVPFSPGEGGQGLPWMVSTAISEMWSGANMAWALCPLLTQGSVELLESHGSDEQKEKYLSKLISGEWTGTMCLTEASAGSDVGMVATKAVKDGNAYKISGQKIFITFGEHDFTKNIIHMVLARTPDAPKGVKGISLFIVPKFLEDGTRNDVRAISIEHKLGIHGSPTAVLNFGEKGGATGYLVGEENAGLKYMFTMMNNARLAVGVEGVALCENSYQKAKAFAEERVQGGTHIINHPDVKRMLLTIRAHTDAMRAFAYVTAKSLDLSQCHANEESRKRNKNIVDISIPVLKAHATDLGFDMSSLAMQVFGGIGYVEESGIAQNIRDSRIAMIYEGTNGIQALDLVMRKICVNDGELFESLSTEVKSAIAGSDYEQLVSAYFSKLSEATENVRKLVASDAKKAGFIANYYLKAFGIIIGAVMLALTDKAVRKSQTASNNEKNETIKFYMDYLLPEANYYLSIIN